MWPNVHWSQIVNQWQTKGRVQWKSSWVKQWALSGLLTGQWVRGNLEELKWPKDSCTTKALPSMGGWLPKAGKQEGITQAWGSSRVERNPFQQGSFSECLSAGLTAYGSLGGGNPVNLVSFTDFLEPLSYFLPELYKLPCRMYCTWFCSFKELKPKGWREQTTVLANFTSIWHKLEPLESMEPQLRNCLHKTVLTASL